ncbi:hypothetical protein [Paenisporosarcina sp. OV554]|uniref:hypothetical protein n=1 Tax=Paenisporosarcina sp. OV554 TaxID=2135694 RepID=UPI000D39378E|nr:hypothetical protein [Paenisporosarcina sp. OV554]PUB17992.1 hypothetical protein C8K15_101194 [Paenisporosarcina sp. OV554]
MEKSTPSRSLVQYESFGKFLQDAWLVSFLVLFMPNETLISPHYIWIAVLFSIAIAVNLLFLKTGYQIAISLVVSVIVGLIVFIFNAPFWLFLFIIAFSVWRVQERYAKIQEDATHDGSFFTLLVVMFAISYFLITVFNKTQVVRDVFILAIVGSVLFVLDRIVVQWLRSKNSTQVPFSKVLFIYMSIISFAAVAFALMLGIGSKAREWFVLLFGDIIELILYPVGVVFVWLQSIFTQFSQEPESKNLMKPQKIEVRPQQFQQLDWLDAPGDFPWLAIIISVSILGIVIIIWRLSKNKTEKVEVAEEQTLYERSVSNLNKEEEMPSTTWLYSMNTNLVRDKYREFESEAGRMGYSRQQNETVREWFNREGWQVSENFYEVYNLVRYSGQQMNDQDGEWFMTELKKLLLKYFDKDV